MNVLYDGKPRKVFFSKIENRWIENTSSNGIQILIKELEDSVYMIEVDVITDTALLFSQQPEIKQIEIIDHEEVDTTVRLTAKFVFGDSERSKEEILKSCIKEIEDGPQD